MQTKILPSYLFQDYDDDVTLQAFVSAYNQMAQEYLDWFVNINLPIYTGLSGQLLDWVGIGVYGVPRPQISAGVGSLAGPLNTYAFNSSNLDYDGTTNASTAIIANDDIYQRVITWNFYKGDGQIFNIPWLKRRILRFLFGVNGQDVLIASTYGIGVAISGVNITISIVTGNLLGIQTVSGQLQYGNGGAAVINILTIANILKSAVQSLATPLPFAYNFTINVS